MQGYLEKITPNVSDAWRAELYLKVRGNPKYLREDQTRFWVAQQVADRARCLETQNRSQEKDQIL
jgi:hypothetical protein